MTLRDFISISTGNLWRMKLRAFLTISGVVIAIAAFVSMISFGAGNQQLIEERFSNLGLFTTMHVYPPDEEDIVDSLPPATLDQAAVEALAAVDGVNLAYPLEAFSVTVALGEKTIETKAQALPGAAVQTKIFSQIVAGSAYTDDSTREALVTQDVLEELGITEPDSIIGEKLIISVEVASIDSGLTAVLRSIGRRVGDRAEQFDFDSLFSAEYRQRVLHEEFEGSMMQFVDGYINNRAIVSDTLTVRGVLKGRSGRGVRVRMEAVIVPVATALRFTGSGLSSDPAQLVQAFSSGRLFASGADSTSRSYPRVTLDLDPHALYQTVQDSVEAMGFKTFSFAQQFDEIKKAFFYFDLALGLVGLIALITASLGIVNTMVMSIVERTREIGVLKSLGADEPAIRRLFLVESGLIGSIGAAGGILFGWLIARLASAIAKAVMVDRGIEAVELFATPLWLVATAFLFGLIVSLAAGLYPANRAARVDPVVALRNE